MEPHERTSQVMRREGTASPRWGLCALALGLFVLPAPAVGQGIPAPAVHSGPALVQVAPATRMPFTLLERGRCAVDRLGAVVERTDTPVLTPPQVQRISDRAAWERFWKAVHPSWRAGSRAAPIIDFNRHMVLVVVGSPGMAEVRLRTLMSTQHKTVATVSGIVWRELAPAGQLAWQAVLCYRQDGRLDIREDEVAAAFNRLVLREPSWRWLPDGRRRELTPEGLVKLRDAFHVQGEHFLADLWRLQTSAPRGPYIPYSKLLEARILAEVVGRPTPARDRFLEVAHRFAGTECARLALHQLSVLGRRDMDQRSRAALDAQRRALAGRAALPDDARRWCELGGLYEGLLTQRPETLFAAVDCYQRAAAISADEELARNATLRAADLHATYLNRSVALKMWWSSICRYPDGPFVGVVLGRMDRVQQGMAGAKAAGQAYRRYLKAFPNSLRAAEVRKLVASTSR